MAGINQLESLKVFRAVVDNGSFTKAAQKLKVSTSWVSKVIERLEATLGTSLITRNTRHIHLTPNGKRCYEQGSDIIALWEELEQEVDTSEQSLSGRLRISAPVSWGLSVMQPILLAFNKKYPFISIDIDLSEQHVNVVKEDFDLALRLTSELSNSALLSRRITTYKRVLCMAQSLIDKLGEPTCPEEIGQYQPLTYVFNEQPTEWSLLSKEGTRIAAFTPHLASNNSMLIKSYLMAGQGIALIPDFLIKDEIDRGEVVEVLTEYQAEPLHLYTLRPNGRLYSHRLSTFLAFIDEYLNHTIE